MSDDFDRFVVGMDQTAEGRRMAGPLVEVADTMDACQRWFEARKRKFTNADLVLMSRLILERADKERERDEKLERGDD